MADIFGKQIDLHPRMGAVGEIVPLAAAVHRPVVGRLRHIGEHQRIDVVGEDALEDKMRERRVGQDRGIDRGRR